MLQINNQPRVLLAASSSSPLSTLFKSQEKMKRINEEIQYQRDSSFPYAYTSLQLQGPSEKEAELKARVLAMYTKSPASRNIPHPQYT